MSIIKKRNIYIASFLEISVDIEDNPINKYDTPKKISCTLNSLSGSTEIEMFGERIKHMSKTLLDYCWIDKIKENDVAYLYGANPDNEVNNGDNANYKVVSILPQNLKIVVYFERLP